MTQINEELVDCLSQPKQLPTAYAVADWIDTDGSKASAPAQPQALLRFVPPPRSLTS
jgi:hypothetical protein